MKRGLNNGDELKSISAIVINRNGGSALLRCLESLAGQEDPVLEVLVIDNDSSAAERDEVRRRFPEVRLVGFSSNLGFARAVNEGISRTSGRFVLTVNNDARLSPAYAGRLARLLASDDRAAGAQGVVLEDDGTAIDTAGLSWNARGEAVPFLAGREPSAGPSAAVEVPGISATAALYRRAALESVAENGMVFDSSFFAYYEDVDLSLRLAREGWRFTLDPGAVAYHEGSLTGRRTPWRRALWTSRNRWKTLLKNFDRSFLRRRLGSLLSADLAHARAVGWPGIARPVLVWPAAAIRALATRPEATRLTGFPVCSAAGK
ncbi:MAG: glycosyltransferase family 2 protein [Thermoanaerobaculia bacterium]